MSEYELQSKKVKCSKCGSNKVTRDLSGDNITGFASLSLSDCKTIGQYAEKQTALYGKQKVEDMRHGFKTEKQGGMSELPTGMSRVDKPSEKVEWTKEGSSKKSRPVKKKKKRRR